MDIKYTLNISVLNKYSACYEDILGNEYVAHIFLTLTLDGWVGHIGKVTCEGMLL
jgi:hypothetical protein